MANKFILAGVGTAQFYTQGFTDLIGSSKTLTESGIGFGVTEEEIRGGLGNSVIGSYFHDTQFTLNMTDALFSLDYLARNVGGTIINSADILTMEECVVLAGKITVTDTPVNFFTNNEIIGFYKLPSESDDDWKKITFNNKTADVDVPNGTVVCVRYCKTDMAGKEFRVNSNFIPDQVSVLLTLPLFKAGTEKATTYTSSSKVGEVQIAIPNFIFSGSQDLSLTASGAATTALSGKALMSFTGTEGCADEGYYGIIKEVVFGANEWDDVKNLAVANADLDMAVGDTKRLEVLAIYGGSEASKLVENSKLTFTTSDATVATVSADGVVTAVADGTTNIEVVVTDKPSLSSYAVATVG
jgi:hypothetical protein